MKKLLPLALLLHSGLLLASPALDTGQRQPLNLHAIGMFMVFVLFTLCITWWAARRTRSTADFYSAGGGILGWQNGLALAGDYMSASTLLGSPRSSIPPAWMATSTSLPSSRAGRCCCC